MNDQPDNLSLVQQQFRRQAEAYSTLKIVTDPRILDNMVEISDVRPDSRVLDVDCGPGFVAIAFASKCRSVLGIRRHRHAGRASPGRGCAARNLKRQLHARQRRADALWARRVRPRHLPASRFIISPIRTRCWPR